MPWIEAGGLRFAVPEGRNVLDALNQAGLNVPFSCRAGSCQACLVRCTEGEVMQMQRLNAESEQQGWRLACQCQVTGDARFALYDPKTDALQAEVVACDKLSAAVLRLRLRPERPLRYAPGQSTVLWLKGVARAYSIASCAEAPWLEFHISCAHRGAFADLLRTLKVGDTLAVAAPHAGGLYYDPAWQPIPLYLLAQGTGLAPLWGLLQQALKLEHQGPIELWHFAKADEHYLKPQLDALAARHPNLYLRYLSCATIERDLAGLRLASRQAHALLCGNTISLEFMAKRLYLAGLPRSHLHTEQFFSG